MYRSLQLVLAGLIAMVFGLSALSRRFPDVAWLQAFRYDPPRLSQEQRARMRRRANIHAGIELILVGIVLPALRCRHSDVLQRFHNHSYRLGRHRLASLYQPGSHSDLAKSSKLKWSVPPTLAIRPTVWL